MGAVSAIASGSISVAGRRTGAKTTPKKRKTTDRPAPLPLEGAEPLQVLPPLPLEPSSFTARGTRCRRGTLLRAGGDEVALRVAGGAAGVRGGVTRLLSTVAAAVRPFSTRISLFFAPGAAAEEFVFTKRRSLGS